ncbi:hypothetical protein ILYODFUR_025693 [Ilyodon furcidens]|uniref:Uncharacterized protein n=1 Tax=Ilyodon furcidens TaxID=33524 RepID=A0ABV0U0G5_9TELE
MSTKHSKYSKLPQSGNLYSIFLSPCLFLAAGCGVRLVLQGEHSADSDLVEQEHPFFNQACIKRHTWMDRTWRDFRVECRKSALIFEQRRPDIDTSPQHMALVWKHKSPSSGI